MSTGQKQSRYSPTHPRTNGRIRVRADPRVFSAELTPMYDPHLPRHFARTTRVCLFVRSPHSNYHRAVRNRDITIYALKGADSPGRR